MKVLLKIGKQSCFSLVSSIALSCSVCFCQADEVLTIHIPKECIVLEKTVMDGTTEQAISEAEVLCRNANYREGMARLQGDLLIVSGKQKGEIVNALGYLKIKAKDYPGAEAEYLKIASGEVAVSEEVYAEAHIRLGYLNILDKDRDEALEFFLPVAQGTVKAKQDDVTDACLRSGALLRLLHRAPEAISVYEQIALQAPDSKDKLYAKLQLSGLLWESGKGDYHDIKSDNEAYDYFEQSKLVAKEIIDDPEVRPGTRAIAELIYLEDFYFQKDYETALDLASEYVVKWLEFMDDKPQDSKVNVTRQIVTAQTWMCFCQYRTGDYTGCIDTARLIRSGTWKKDDPYGNFNVFGYSLLYEAFSQEALGIEEEGKQLRELAKEIYPDWYDAVIDSVETKLGLKKEEG